MNELALAYAGITGFGSGFSICSKLKNPRRSGSLSAAGAFFQEFNSSKNDEIRQDIIIKYGMRLLKSSIRSLIIFMFIAAVVSAPILLNVLPDDYERKYFVILTAFSIAGALLVAAVRHSAARQGGRFLQRLSERLALRPQIVRETSLDLERALFLRAARSPVRKSDRPVYICGMPRSGTSILLDILSAYEEFRSLRYSDMPFVLAPNLNALLLKRFCTADERVERPQRDGLTIDLQSAASLEEVFWSTMGSEQSGAGSPAAAGNSAHARAVAGAFADYRALVVHSTPSALRYLSKNNGNIVRLDLLGADDDTHILVPYRDPVATAASSLRLHREFTALQAEDPYGLSYMAWTGHYEFGQGHRRLLPFSAQANSDFRPDQFDYWVDYWSDIHEAILARQNGPITLIAHEALCANPQPCLHALFGKLGVQDRSHQLALRVRGSAGPTGLDVSSSPALARARAVQSVLQADARNLVAPQ